MFINGIHRMDNSILNIKTSDNMCTYFISKFLSQKPNRMFQQYMYKKGMYIGRYFLKVLKFF